MSDAVKTQDADKRANAKENAGLAVMPHDDDAEKAALGAALLSNDAYALLLSSLSSDDMYSDVHKEIFVQLDKFRSENPGHSVDPVNFGDHLVSHSAVEKCGGLEYVSALMEDAPTTVNAENYIRIVKRHSLRRKLIRMCYGYQQKGYDLSDDVYAVLDKLASDVISLSSSSAKGQDYVNLKNLLVAHQEALEERMEHKIRSVGYETGFNVLDWKIHGFRPGQFVVVAARTGVGKTAFALACILNMTREKRKDTIKDENGEYVEYEHFVKPAFYSYEMGVDEIIYRLLSAKSCVSHTALINGDIKVKSEEQMRLYKAYQQLYDRDIYFVEASGMTLGDIKSAARRMKRDGVDILFIDYIGLINTDDLDSRMQPHQKIAYISRNLKMLARELNMPIVALSQLNREAQGTTPNMANIRDSGAIEQDADTIILLHDPSSKDGPKGEGPSDQANESVFGIPEKMYEGAVSKPIECIIEKQRSGATGRGFICFHPDTVSYCNYEKEDV